MFRVKLIGLLMILGLLAVGTADGQAPSWKVAKPAVGSDALRTAAGDAQVLMWEVTENNEPLKVVDDKFLGVAVAAAEKPATLVGRFAMTPGMEVSCRVRLATTPEARNAYVYAGLAAEPGKLERERRVDLSGTFDGVTAGFNFKPYPTISPVLDPMIRLPLERDMAAAAPGQDRWISLRIQTSKDSLRIWVDDRLRVNREDKALAGMRPIFQLSANVRIADLRIGSMAKIDARFEPLPLDAYTNARNLTGDKNSFVRENALPLGETVTVSGIPMRFADPSGSLNKSDHIDLSPSLCREGNWEGYHAANSPRFGGTAFRDPARIQLALPNGSYRALHVVAAFDEADGRVPILSAMFYRPGASFPMVFESAIPSCRAKQASATPLNVKLQNGDSANLWLVTIPLDPAMLASFADLDIVELELTKQVFQHRSYPDPYMYGWHQGGMPSGVHVYAVTLERPTVNLTLEPSQFGHVWKAGQTPQYTLKLRNLTAEPRTITLKAETVSYDETEKPAPQTREIKLAPGQETPATFQLPVKLNGIHAATFTLTDGDKTWIEKRNLCRLAPDTRAEKWTEGQGALFGYWSYFGGHYTPPADENIRLMAWAGSRAVVHKPGNLSPETMRDYWDKHAMRGGPNAWPVHVQWDLGVDNPDPAKVAAFQKKAIEEFIRVQGENPDMVTFFPEPGISSEQTVASPQDYWGEPPRKMNEQERAIFKAYWNTAKFAAEAVRARWPNTKILIPWGDPLFIVPFLREGFPKNLIDGSGLDMIGFERLPEQQIHQASTHRLFILKNEFRKAGIEKPMLPYVEGVFVPTEPGACTWNEQADLLLRWNLISLAYGIDRYYSAWTTFDAGSYYGTEHYAGCGIMRRIPYADPKPAYATYATMTRILDRSNFTRWLPTGSLSTYCLEFEHPERGPTYAMWTLRGKRPITLTLEKDAQATVTDTMDNAKPVASKDKAVTVTLSTTPVFVNGTGKVASAMVGEQDHSDAIAWSRNRNRETWHTGVVARRAEPEVRHEVPLGTLGDGRWKLTDERDEVYQTNNYDTTRYPGKLSARIAPDEGHGASLAVKLEKQDAERKLMPFFGVVKADKPVTIPGKALALGMWVKGASDWGRVIYSLRDARGERWISIGHKDEWNCDDVHSWSAFAFDGWRYLRFELPGHEPYDNYRNHGTTWWRFAGGDGVVDLPLTLEKVIVERRTHILYVNDIQPTDAENRDVQLGALVAEYGSAADATPAVVERGKVRMPLPKSEAEMQNPITAAAAAPLAATTLRGVKDPDWGYDGTRCHVNFDAVTDAKQYQVWVAAHPDGRGAQPMAVMAKPGQILEGLRPQTTFYLWVTYTNAEGKSSKPSNRLEIKLVDAFGMK